MKRERNGKGRFSQMLHIKCGKPEKQKGVLIPPLPMPRIRVNREEGSSGASTSLKDVFKKHDRIKKANII